MSAEPEFGNVDQERLVNAENEPNQWLTYGGTYNEQRYSTLDQINVENIDQLGLAWSVDLPPGNPATGPIEVDGTV